MWTQSRCTMSAPYVPARATALAGFCILGHPGLPRPPRRAAGATRTSSSEHHERRLTDMRERVLQCSREFVRREALECTWPEE